MLATAVIVSYNRQDVLRRQLLYYANKPIHLIFADGSDDDWGSGDSGSIGEMTWEYFRISQFDSYLKRIVEAVRRVETEFMFFIDDEECILWTGVEQAVEFLRQNPDHSCAGGRADHMRFYSGRLGILKWRHWGDDYKLLSSDSFERLFTLMKSGRSANLYYNVLRTSEISKFLDFVHGFDLSSPLLLRNWETAFTGFWAISGKWQMGKYPFWIRYGGSQKNPSKKVYFDMADEKFLAEFFELALTDTVRSSSESQIRSAEDITATGVFSWYSSQATESKARHNLRDAKLGTSKLDAAVLKLKKLPKSLLVKFFFLIWRVAPSLHRVLRPNGVRRLKTHAKIYGYGNERIIEDLSRVEKIWGQFPNGLSQSQYEQELARV